MFCSWCKRNHDKLHVVNADNTAGICEECSTGVLQGIQWANVQQERKKMGRTDA